jgi:hypothetical protein
MGGVDPTSGIFRGAVGGYPGPGNGGYILGSENSARGGATFHADFGVSKQFTGPWDSNFYLGIALINVLIGPVAPEVPVIPSFDFRLNGIGVKYERSFILPPLPTVTFRMEF